MTFPQLNFSFSRYAHRSDPWGFVFFPRRFALQAIAGALIAVILSASSSWAAFVTLKEAEVDAIFSQASFGANPVDIRYLPTITHIDASLLNIDSNAKFSNLVGQFNSSTIHYAYFVDTIDWCGSTNTATVGCAYEPGNDFVVESNFVAGSNGAELLAHELSHNLFLSHDGAPNNDNLMDSVLSSNTTLTAIQAATILNRPSVQTDAFGKFIQVQPVLISSGIDAVPEPSTALLAASLLAALACNARRWRI